MTLELLQQRVIQHLTCIYGEVELSTTLEQLADRLINTMLCDDPGRDPTPHKNRWDEQDMILIAYGDSIIRHANTDEAVAKPEEPPLHTLHRVVKKPMLT